VIILAVTDWRKGKGRAGLERFFYSEWFDELAQLVGPSIDPQAIRKELKVNRPLQMLLWG